jgi:hypothetical protein
MKTRAKGSGKAATGTAESAKSAGPKVQLGADSANPPQLFILPDNISKEARIVTLQNPRLPNESRYLTCPDRGFYEFKAFTEPKTTPRSWLLSQDVISTQKEAGETPEAGLEVKNTAELKGYVARNADLFVATPIDPLFLVLPSLAPVPTTKTTTEPPMKLFLSGDDYLEKLASFSPQLKSFLRTESIRALLEERMTAVCDTVEAGDETMYRLNEEKLLEEILRKAKKMISRGLPASMEEKLVRKALDVPILGINREASLLIDIEEDSVPPESGSQTPAADTPNTQTTVSSTDTAASSLSGASTAATSFSEESLAPPPEKLKTLPPIGAPDGVADLLRLRTAFFFICSNYIAPDISASLKKLVASSTSVDFSPLDSHLVHLAKIRQEVVSMRSLSDFSRKRSMIEDQDGETRAEKKRKKEEEEKRQKAGESRGVKNLKKVNVSGMKKMSDFFKKK